MDQVVVAALEQHFELVPVCPEVDCGMGVPRESMRLKGNVIAPRLVTISSHIDRTDQLERWTKRRIAEMKQEKLAGFVLKSGSPSCGLSVNVYDDKDVVAGNVSGLFARRVTAGLSRRLVAEAEQLHDESFRTDFIQRLRTFAQK
jgi:uncharacterized protein YbbK (DUF523 family)